MRKETALVFGALLMVAACGRQAETGATAKGPPKPAAVAEIAPAIIPPADVARPAEPPSYEVAIASAAADRHEALERCAKQPEAVRTSCEQEANAAFVDAEHGLQDLRGNQQ